MRTLNKIRELFLSGNYKPRVLVYGAAGTGKTWFACTFPRPYIFDFDGGVGAALALNIPGDSFADEKGADAYRKFEKRYNEVLKMDDIDTIVIDSLTSFAEHYMRMILQMQGGYTGQTPKIGDWGQFIQHIKRLFWEITGEGSKGLVVTAHEQMVSTGEGTHRFLPLISGKELPGQLGVFFDEVYYSKIKGGGDNRRWVLQTVGTSSTISKSRLSAVADLDREEPNDWGKIWPKVLTGIEKMKEQIAKDVKSE